MKLSQLPALARSRALAATVTLTLTLAACAPQPVDPTSEEQVQGDEEPTVSILRPEIEPPETIPAPETLEPYRATIGFPDGGKALSEDAKAALKAALAAPQMVLGLPITLSAHSDSSGSDRVNLDASESRGLAVAKWLIDNGVDAKRITVVAFGEQNPIAPNARPDGSPNEDGRAANRRVEIEIAVAEPRAAPPQNDETAPAASVEAGD